MAETTVRTHVGHILTELCLRDRGQAVVLAYETGLIGRAQRSPYRGIVLPDTAKERPQTAEVVAVGDAEEIKVGIGDVVVFRRYGGTEFSFEGEDYLIVEADDILGVVEG